MPRDLARVHLQLGKLSHHILPDLAAIASYHCGHYGFLNRLAHLCHDLFDLERYPLLLPVGYFHVPLKWKGVESHYDLLVALQLQTLLAEMAYYN